MNMFDFMPKIINGWRLVTENTITTNKDLYSYIDGGAELFISYGYNKISYFLYEKNDEPEIRIDIFEMTEAKNAYGVFTLSSEKNDEQFGQASQYIKGSLIFWKDKYFISIMAGSETEKSKITIFDIAKLINNNINKKGRIPKIINLIPNDNKVQFSEIYFNHHAWQNTYYFISDENIFNIDNTCNAVLSSYNYDNSTCYLLLIEYGLTTKAEAAHNKFLVTFFDEFIDEPITKLENEKWISCQFYKNYVYAILNAKNKDCIENLSKSLIYKIKTKF